MGTRILATGTEGGYVVQWRSFPQCITRGKSKEGSLVIERKARAIQEQTEQESGKDEEYFTEK